MSKKKELLTIKPNRELKENEEIVDVFKLINGNYVSIGLLIRKWDSASMPTMEIVGCEIVKND